jgi:hypothetical protein
MKERKERKEAGPNPLRNEMKAEERKRVAEEKPQPQKRIRLWCIRGSAGGLSTCPWVQAPTSRRTTATSKSLPLAQEDAVDGKKLSSPYLELSAPSFWSP